jgi:hypothetical protein
MTHYSPSSGEPVVAGSTSPTTPLTPAAPAAPPAVPESSGDDASMKDKARDSAQAGKEAAGNVASSAAENAKQVVEESKTQGRQLVGEARGQLHDHARTQHKNLVSNLTSLGDELSGMAGKSEQQGPASELAATAGQRVHDVASWLDSREPGQLVDELRGFARRRPGVFIAGALVAGVLAGRLTRGAVDVHRSDESTGDGLTGDGLTGDGLTGDGLTGDGLTDGPLTDGVPSAGPR